MKLQLYYDGNKTGPRPNHFFAEENGEESKKALCGYPKENMSAPVADGNFKEGTFQFMFENQQCLKCRKIALKNDSIRKSKKANGACQASSLYRPKKCSVF